MTESELHEFLIKNFPKEDINCEWKEMKNLKKPFVVVLNSEKIDDSPSVLFYDGVGGDSDVEKNPPIRQRFRGYSCSG